MKRRDFIKLSLNTLLLLSLSGLVTKAEAGDISIDNSVIVNIMLDGGPDFRHIIVPVYADDNDDETSYAAKFWKARSSIWGGTTDELKQAYKDNYVEIDSDIFDIDFAIHKDCAWLKDEIEAGNVAIISNVIASTNRDHHHSQVIMESGSLTANAHNLDVSGWAGRAATELNAKVISCSSEIRLICNGPHPTDPLKHDNSCVIANYNSREPGLESYNTQGDLDAGEPDYKWNQKGKLDRALTSYYALKRGTIPTSSPFSKAMAHEKQLRDFGNLLRARLESVTIPTSIDTIMNDDDKNIRLDSSSFAKQILSLHDSYASQDILNMRLASLSYSGWDSHKELKKKITPKFEDIFGTSKGLASLVGELDDDAYKKSVFIVGGEFGRQLKSNGDIGNDHGRGNTMLVIGGKVNGGLYGELFPDSELDKLNVKNEDIEGLTSMFKVYAEILNWQSDGLGDNVFEDLASQDVESGVDLTTLMEA